MAAAGAAPAAKLEDADALIDSVETFIFDCDGEAAPRGIIHQRRRLSAVREFVAGAIYT